MRLGHGLMGPFLCVALSSSFSSPVAAEEMWVGAGYELRYQAFFFGDEDPGSGGRRRGAVTIPAVMHGIRIQDQSGVLGAALGGAGAAEMARREAISDAWRRSDTKVGDTVEYSYESPSPATGLMQTFTLLFSPIGEFEVPVSGGTSFDGSPLPTSITESGWYIGLDWDIPLSMFALKITDNDLILPKFGTWMGLMELKEADTWYFHGGLDLGVSYQRFLPFNLTALLTAESEFAVSSISLMLGEQRWFNGRLEAELVWAPVDFFWLRGAAGAGFQPMHFETFDSSMAFGSIGAGFAFDLL